MVWNLECILLSIPAFFGLHSFTDLVKHFIGVFVFDQLSMLEGVYTTVSTHTWLKGNQFTVSL